MWKTFLAVNFRCFGGLLVQPLDRINLISGKNNSGKTSLLEAIHLHRYPQDCQLAFSISELRGFDNQARLSESLMSWLFYDRKTNTRIRFVCDDEKSIPRELQIAFGDSAEARAQFPEADKFVEGTFLENDWKTDRKRIIMKTERQGKQHFAVGLLMPSGMASLGSKESWDGPSVFLSSWKHAPDEDVQVFSRLEIAKRQEEILPTLQLLEPRLKRLALIMLDDKPVIHADIGLSRLIPITIMGEGIRRLLMILGSIAHAPKGRVLIDEIENGLHHSVMPAIWMAIAHLARKEDVQVFATTHNYQCIQAAHEAFKASDVYDLRLHRLAQVKEEIKVGTYDQETLGTAMEHFMQVR